jgi:hypothetical protein
MAEALLTRVATARFRVATASAQGSKTPPNGSYSLGGLGIPGGTVVQRDFSTSS